MHVCGDFGRSSRGVKMQQKDGQEKIDARKAKVHVRLHSNLPSRSPTHITAEEYIDSRAHWQYKVQCSNKKGLMI